MYQTHNLLMTSEMVSSCASLMYVVPRQQQQYVNIDINVIYWKVGDSNPVCVTGIIFLRLEFDKHSSVIQDVSEFPH